MCFLTPCRDLIDPPNSLKSRCRRRIRAKLLWVSPTSAWVKIVSAATPGRNYVYFAGLKVRILLRFFGLMFSSGKFS